MDKPYKVIFTLHYSLESHAQIVFQSLAPELKENRFERSDVLIDLHQNKLIVRIKAKDPIAAKASMNSLFRWITVSNRTLTTISKET
ncbi:KEOPS complex subunit Pcc1 [Candidatus Hodarchaeum mangrovi]